MYQEKQKKSVPNMRKRLDAASILILIGIIVLLYAKVFYSYEKTYGKNKTRAFGATYMTMNNNFYPVLNNEIRSAVEKKGDRLMTLDPALDQKKQTEQIYYLIQQKVDAIFINPVDWKGIRGALRAAKKAEIPVIIVDTPVYDEDLVSCTVVSDNYNAGVLCAKDLMKRRKSARILLLEHEKAKSAQDRIRGFLDTIQGRQEYQVVARADTEGQTERTLPKVNQVIKNGKKFDVVMALNDPTAIGALAALDQKGIREQVLVYGIDGSPDGKGLIKENMMTATSAQSPKQIGKEAIRSAYGLLDKKEVSKKIIIPVQIITYKNINRFDVNNWQ